MTIITTTLMSVIIKEINIPKRKKKKKKEWEQQQPQ